MPIALVILLEIFIKIIQISLVLACLFIFLTGIVYLDSIVQRYFSSQKNLTKINKNKRLKTFANKHKFLFFRDRWKGYYQGFVVEIKIGYNLQLYQTEYYIHAPVSENLYYDLEKLPNEYHFYNELNYICIYKYEPFLFIYPKTNEIEKHLDEMITQIQNIQVKHY